MEYREIARLIFSEYYPEEITTDTLFAVNVEINGYFYKHVHKLDKLPRDTKAFLEERLPVKPYLIIDIDSNPDVPPMIAAHPKQINLSIDEMNYISLRREGLVEILVYEDDEPVLEDGKVVIFIGEEFDDWDEEEEEEEYEDEEFDEDVELDDEWNWDDDDE